ncbi:MAG: MBL fold metallo-hydrolase [Acidimicrobiales bacterium]
MTTTTEATTTEATTIDISDITVPSVPSAAINGQQAECRVGVHSPYRIAADTWVIPELVNIGPGAFVPLNSMVITAAEPVIVDTGNLLSRNEWLDAAFSVVDPADVRWIFLSHDDHDHIGNLDVVLELCPQATLVTNHWTVERVGRAMELPLHRMRWINSGETFSVGDRTLVAMRPPVFDSPTTRGLFDPKTGVYWAVDTFATASPGFTVDAAETPHDMWAEGLLDFNRLVSVWHTMVDPAKFNVSVDAVASLGMTTIAGGHTAPLRGARIADAFELVRRLPHLPAIELPTNADLDAILAAHAAPAAA